MKKAVSNPSRSSYFLPFAVGCLLCGALCAPQVRAQVMEPPGTMPGQRLGLPPGQTRPVTQPGASQQAPAQMVPQSPQAKPSPDGETPHAALSPSDKPAEPAKVAFQGGNLTIQADNSALNDILQQIASTSGMTIDGLGKDYRVFGIYGPGNPRQVLSDLLTDSGYNFMMVGDTTDGAPKQLILTQQSNAAPQVSSNSRPQPADDEDEPPQPVFIQNPVDPNAPVPGAPSYPQPQQQPQANQGGIKSPQQILQELQQLRQQQQQQQQSNPQ